VRRQGIVGRHPNVGSGLVSNLGAEAAWPIPVTPFNAATQRIRFRRNAGDARNAAGAAAIATLANHFRFIPPE